MARAASIDSRQGKGREISNPSRASNPPVARRDRSSRSVDTRTTLRLHFSSLFRSLTLILSAGILIATIIPGRVNFPIDSVSQSLLAVFSEVDLCILNDGSITRINSTLTAKPSCISLLYLLSYSHLAVGWFRMTVNRVTTFRSPFRLVFPQTS